MARGAAGLREDSLRLHHSVDVVGVGLDSDKDHSLPRLAPLDRRVGVEHRATRGRTR